MRDCRVCERARACIYIYMCVCVCGGGRNDETSFSTHDQPPQQRTASAVRTAAQSSRECDARPPTTCSQLASAKRRAANPRAPANSNVCVGVGREVRIRKSATARNSQRSTIKDQRTVQTPARRLTMANSCDGTMSGSTLACERFRLGFSSGSPAMAPLRCELVQNSTGLGRRRRYTFRYTFRRVNSCLESSADRPEEVIFSGP